MKTSINFTGAPQSTSPLFGAIPDVYTDTTFFQVSYIRVIPWSWFITGSLLTDFEAHIAESSMIDKGYPKNTRSVVSPFSYSDWHQTGRIRATPLRRCVTLQNGYVSF